MNYPDDVTQADIDNQVLSQGDCPTCGECREECECLCLTCKGLPREECFYDHRWAIVWDRSRASERALEN